MKGTNIEAQQKRPAADPPSVDGADTAATAGRRAVDVALRSCAARRPALVAGLVARFRDLEIAEDALQQAFEEALEQWPRRGVPRNPEGWLAVVAKRRTIDQLRRQGRWQEKSEALRRELPSCEPPAPCADGESEPLGDEVLCLLFTCCHPALAREAQIALMLHTVCGLSTQEIAHGFLVPKATLAQRLVRAKRKIRCAAIPFRVPPPERLAERLEQVLLSIYLIFNEGHSASSGAELSRADLCSEALRLARLVADLLPREGEAAGLWALLELIDARRAARVGDGGEMVELSSQDRSLWDHDRLRSACSVVEQVLRAGRVGPFQVQAAIQAVHAEAECWAATDWRQILGLYDVLRRMQPTPVVELNRAVALRFSGDLRGAVDSLESAALEGALASYAPYHAAKAECYEQLGRRGAARAAWLRAAQLSSNEVQRRWLEQRSERSRCNPAAR